MLESVEFEDLPPLTTRAVPEWLINITILIVTITLTRKSVFLVVAIRVSKA